MTEALILQNESRQDSSIIRSLDRSLDLIESLSHHPEGVTVTLLAAEMRIPKSSAFRVLNTLRTRGYVQQNPITERYRLGLRFLALARSVAEESDLRNIATPYLRELQSETDETVHLAVPVGHSMVYIDKVESSRSVRLASRMGDLASFHSTALGKAYLSALSVEERRAFVRNLALERRTDRTIVARDRLLTELDRCARQGFALDNIENEEGVRCVGAAVVDRAGEPVAAISVSAPESRFPKKRAMTVGPLCADISSKLSQHLGDVSPISSGGDA
ncbi:MAG: IclR family transcriptional regulator [Actinomycetota bacterium]